MVKPIAWTTRESVHRLADGGNCKGAVPMHKNESNISNIPLYGPEEVQSIIEEERNWFVRVLGEWDDTDDVLDVLKIRLARIGKRQYHKED